MHEAFESVDLNPQPSGATKNHRKLSTLWGQNMTRFTKLAGPLAIVAALAFTSAPAKAQFGGMGMENMEQMAPMIEMMKQKMGKKRFGQMMQMMGPMMAQMESQGGFGGMGGGFGGMGGLGGMGGGMSMGGMDMGQMMAMMGSMKGLIGGGRKKVRRARR
jgi:hypothetical protein